MTLTLIVVAFKYCGMQVHMTTTIHRKYQGSSTLIVLVTPDTNLELRTDAGTDGRAIANI